MTHVKSPRHRVLQPFHPLHQIGFWSLNEQVVVAGHQNPGMHSPTGLLASFSQTLRKESPVIGIEKNRFPPIASYHEAIVGTGKFDPDTSGHAALFSLLSGLLSREFCYEMHTDP